MTVHIALLGRTIEPVLRGFQYYGSVNRLYLLHSPNSPDFKFRALALDVKKRLKSIGFGSVILQEIDAFDMLSIVNSITSIGRTEPPPIYVNITGGTNLMAGAACAASFFIGARAYYVQGKVEEDISQSKVIELPIPDIPSYQTLDKIQFRILREIHRSGGSIQNSTLRESLDLSPQKLSYHIKKLEDKRLITTTRGDYASVSARTKDLRRLFVELTNAGKLMLSWQLGII